MSGQPNNIPNTNNDARGRWDTGAMEDLSEYFQTHLFIAGLKDNLCPEVMKTGKTFWAEVYKVIMNLEIIHTDTSTAKKGLMASAITKELSAESELNDEELKALNANCAQNGQPPY
jgi:hypothetical protein